MKTLYSIAFLLFVNLTIAAQCISNVTFTESMCDDFGEVYLTIDFDFDPNEIGTMGFRIEGPLLNQDYNYTDLPVNYGPFPGSCFLGEIVIFDLEVGSCQISQELDPCCDNIPNCAITNLDYEVICDAGSFIVEVLDIEREFASSQGGWLTLLVNGFSWGSAQFVPYNQLPYSVNFQDHPGCGSTLQLSFIDNHRPCDYVTPTFYNCCPNPALCGLSVIPDYAMCDADNNLEVYLNLNAEFTGNLFDVWEDGNYLGEFDVGPGNTPLPFVILVEAEQPIGQFIEYEVCSVEAGCCATTSFQFPCAAPCNVNILDGFISNCSGGLMDLNLITEYMGIGNTGFNLSIDGVFIGNFEYGVDLMFPNVPHANNPEVEVLICDDLIPSCCSFFTLINECYTPPPVFCSISNLNAMPYGCANDTFNLVISFDTTAVGSQGLLTMNGGFSQPIDYDSTTYVEGFSTLDSIITIIVCDEDSIGCCDTTALFNYCVYPPSCSIDTLISTFVECDGDTAIIEVNYAVTNPGSNGFGICIDGVLIDTFVYDLSFPYVLVAVPIVCTDSLTFNLEIKDLGNPNCRESNIITIPCCGIPPSCTISNFDMNLNCVNDTVVASLVFDTMLVNDQAIIYVNGLIIDTIGYNESSVSFVNTVDSMIQLVICDVLDSSCCDTVTQPNLCYVPIPDTCSFTSLSVVQNGCSLGDAVLDISYTVDHPGTGGFGVYVDGQWVGSYNYPLQPTITLPPSCNDSVQIEITLRDVQDIECYISAITDSLCCDTIVPPNCNLFGLTAEPIGDCYNGLIDIFIEFDTLDVSMGFHRFVNGVDYGYVDYIDPNSAIVGVLDTTPTLEVVICDALYTSCCDTVYMPNPCYNLDCEFSNLMVTQIDSCDGELITIHFDFDIANPGSNGYVIEGGLPLLDTFAYSDSMVMTLVGDCMWDYTLYFSDIDNPSCYDSLEVGVLCCEVNSCFVSNPSGEALTNATNSSVELKADIADTCPSEVEVILNGISEGMYLHDNGLIKLVTGSRILTDSIDVRLCVDLEDEICSAFRIDNDILSNTADIDAGVDFFLNPNGELVVNQKFNNELELSVYSIDGNRLYQLETKDQHNIISLRHLINGMYLIRVQGDKESQVKKVLLVN